MAGSWELIKNWRDKERADREAALSGLGGFSPVTPTQLSPQMSFAELQGLATKFGGDIYEMQRRRLAAQSRGSQRETAQFFAGRGGGASSAAASALRANQNLERSALSEASQQSQLQGYQLANQEAARREQGRQFDAGYGQAFQLQQMSGYQQAMLQQLQGQQQLALMRYQADMQRRQQRGGILGGLFGGIGQLAGGFIPGFNLLSSLGGGGEPPGYNYYDKSQPWLGGY